MYNSFRCMYGGIAQLARAHGSYPWCHKFKSYYRYHVGTSFACSDFLLHKKSITSYTVPPFCKKAPSRRLFACKRTHYAFGSLPLFCSFSPIQVSLVPIFCYIKKSARLKMTLLIYTIYL